MKKPIIDLGPDTPRLKLKLMSPGCNGGQIITHASMYITRVKCEEELPTSLPPMYLCGGCDNKMEIPPITTPQPVIPTLLYESIGVDENGFTEFYFDDKLFESPSGRYTACVKVDGCDVMDFDINLGCDLQIAEITVVRSRCGDTKC